MNYKSGFTALYGAAGAAIEELFKAKIVPPELDNAIQILRDGIAKVEVMINESADNDPPLTPSLQGKDCIANGEHDGVECCCDECDYYLECFPDTLKR